jgi:hypothetical protein
VTDLLISISECELSVVTGARLACERVVPEPLKTPLAVALLRRKIVERSLADPRFRYRAPPWA